MLDLKVTSTDEINCNGNLIIWDSNIYRNYLEAKQVNATYETPSSLEMFHDLDSAAGSWHDLMEIRDAMDKAGIGSDHGWGIIFNINDDKHVYIELEIINSLIRISEDRTHYEIVKYALEVLNDVSAHTANIPDIVRVDNAQSFIFPFSKKELKTI